MGLLDDVGGLLSGVSNQGATQQSPLLQAALGLMQQQGGLTGLLGQLQQGGLKDQVASWVSTGENQPVSPDQMHGALGAGTVGALASKLGMSAGDVSSGLATLLPNLVNQMTPNGSVPENHGDLLSQALSSFLK